MRLRNALRLMGLIGLVVTASDCGGGAVQQSSTPESVAQAADDSIIVDTVPVPLSPANPSATTVGDFSYAGGLVLTSRQTDQLHGLSDVEVTDANQLTAVGDVGVLFGARVVLDDADRLVGLADAYLRPLMGEDGTPLTDKADADAEGLVVLPNGDRLVSFERHHRIWMYPSAGGPPRPVPVPDTAFPDNGGMEALAADPEAGPDAFIVGAEVSGETWSCGLRQSRCIKSPTLAKPDGFGLVAMRRVLGSQTAYLLRAFDEALGNRASLQIFRSGRLVAHLDLAPPMTVDNYEGLAAVPLRHGGVRFYLISDDNASARQRTMLLAFDWRSK